MFILKADKTKLTVAGKELITSGSVNAYPVRFEFSDDWDGLTRTAVFRAGDEARSVLLDGGNETVIPWEVLKKPYLQLFCGVYGTRNGDTVLPTIWADMGAIWKGAEPSGEKAQPPTPDIWEQKLDAKADGLEYDGLRLSLTSGDRTLSTVQIVSGGGHGKYIPVFGKDGISPTAETVPADEGTVVTITDVNGPHSFTVCNGKDGSPGPEGQRGEQGPPGEPGVGVPQGGTAGQILVKQSDDPYDTEWTDNTADKVKFSPGGTGIASTDVQGAIAELFTSVSNGKQAIASAIADKGVDVDRGASFEKLAEAIGGIRGTPEGLCEITLTAEPEERGTVSGGGCASAGMTCSVKAEPAEGYAFAGWEEDGDIVERFPSYSFPVEKNRCLTANFTVGPPTYIAGRDWFKANAQTGAWWTVNYCNDKFIAVGNGGIMAYSFDGRHWEQLNPGAASHLHAVCYGNGKYIACGTEKELLYSSDGINWESREFSYNVSGFESIRFLNHKFIAVTSSGWVLSSDDGIDWIRYRKSSAEKLYDAAYGNGRYVVVGSQGIIRYSSDAETWIDSTSPATGDIHSIIYDGEKFVMSADSGYIVYGADETSWEQIKTTESADLLGINYGDDKYVITGEGGAILYGESIETLKKANSPAAAAFRGAAYNDGTFAACGCPGDIFYSKDMWEI